MIELEPAASASASSPDLRTANSTGQTHTYTQDAGLPTPPRPFHRARRSSSRSIASTLSSLPENSADFSLSATSLPGAVTRRSGEETRARGEWVLDVGALQGRKEAWGAGERVVLVLGEYTPQALHPIFSNPTFDNCLVILASLRPKPPIPPRASRTAIHQLPHPTWAHSTIQDLVQAAIPIARTWRKKQSRARSRASSFFSRRPSESLGVGIGGGTKSGVCDCVINFLSPALRFDPRQAMPKLLREVVMSTTALVAVLPSKGGIGAGAGAGAGTGGGAGAAGGSTATTLVHVLPTSYPAALPTVVERYLLSLLPTLAPHQRLRPLVLAQPTFSAERVSGSYDGSIISAPEAVLLDLVVFAPESEQGGDAALYLASWSGVAAGAGAGAGPGSGAADGYGEDVLGAPLMDRRGSDNSVRSDLSSSSTLDIERGPITPSASTESVDRLGRPRSNSTSSYSHSHLHSHLRAADDNKSLQPYAHFSHAPKERSRLSHVETFTEPDSPTSANENGISRASLDAPPPPPPRAGTFGQGIRSTSLRNVTLAREAEDDFAPAHGAGDGMAMQRKVETAETATKKKRSVFGWMRRA